MNPLDLSQTAVVGVSSHAVTKLRERMPGKQWKSISGDSIRRIMQQAYEGSADSREHWWELVRGRPCSTWVIPLGEVLDSNLFGVIREDDRAPGKACFITVLSQEMVQNNISSNRWTRDPQKLGTSTLLTPMLKLGLEAVTLPDPDLYVVTWRWEGSSRKVSEEVQHHQLESFVSLLLNRPETSELRVWKHVPFTVEQRAKVPR